MQTTPKFPAARLSPMLGALLLAAFSTAAHGQSLNGNSLRVAEPITAIRSTTGLANPTVSLNRSAIQPTLPDVSRIAPGLSPTALPAIEATRPAPSGLALSPVDIVSGGGRSVAATGLGRLVAPGSENANVVVGRLGTAIGSPNLTVDFEGDGLLTFEVAPDVVGVSGEASHRGGHALAGLAGQHVALATGTADRVLDGLINVEGVTQARTIEIAAGVIVLGGGQDPAGDDARNRDDKCLAHGCYDREEPSQPGPDVAPEADDLVAFTGFREPPMPGPAADLRRRKALLDTSVRLTLRNRQRHRRTSSPTMATRRSGSAVFRRRIKSRGRDARRSNPDRHRRRPRRSATGVLRRA